MIKLAAALSILVIASIATSTAVAKPTLKAVIKCPGKIAGVQFYKSRTWQLQLAMSKKLTPARNHEYTTNSCNYVNWVAKKWRKRARTEFANYLNPPHKSEFLCIYSHENGGYGWRANTGNGYYGGLQMDREFQSTYGYSLYKTKGTANNWKWIEQIWVAERAYRTRGFYPWPNTARYCGLI